TLILAEFDRLAIADKRKAADTNFTSALLRPRLRETNGRHLRLAIGAARNQVLVHGVGVQPLDGLDADDALMLRLVGQHRRPRDIADGIDAGHIGFAVAIDHDAAAIGFDAELLKSEILDIADNTDRRDHA